MKSYGRFAILFSSCLCCVVLISCAKSNQESRAPARLEVYLTDDPGNFEELLIDLQDIQINFSTSQSSGWQSLDGVSKGSYDLLRLVNGKDTLVSNAEVPAGRMRQLRLVLGTENFVRINGKSFHLDTRPDQQTGLNLPVLQDLNGGSMHKITLDFDVARSVVNDDSIHYRLVPKIRFIVESVGGGIKGVIRPADSSAVIWAIQPNDTVTSSFTGEDGNFVLRGLAEGYYTLSIQSPIATLRDTLVDSVKVINRETTRLDTIYLQP